MGLLHVGKSNGRFVHAPAGIFGACVESEPSWHMAIAAIEKSEQINPLGRLFAYNAFVLAMSHQQLGSPEVARQWHHQAGAWIETNEFLLKTARHTEEIRDLEIESVNLLVIKPAK